MQTFADGTPYTPAPQDTHGPDNLPAPPANRSVSTLTAGPVEKPAGTARKINLSWQVQVILAVVIVVIVSIAAWAIAGRDSESDPTSAPIVPEEYSGEDYSDSVHQADVPASFPEETAADISVCIESDLPELTRAQDDMGPGQFCSLQTNTHLSGIYSVDDSQVMDRYMNDELLLPEVDLGVSAPPGQQLRTVHDPYGVGFLQNESGDGVVYFFSYDASPEDMAATLVELGAAE